MPTITLNGRQAFYSALGDGPPVILLHNATGSIMDWRFLMPGLARSGYRAIAYDRPGFGKSEPVAHWPLDYLHQDRDDLLALMDALQLEQAALIGNSDGATISLLAAAKAPHRVAAVVAESPHLWYERETLPIGFRYFSETLQQDPRFRKAMQRAHGDQADVVIARWRERWLDPAFFDWDESAVLEQIQTPVLIIHGEADPFFPVSHSQRIAEKLPNARLQVWPGIGHVPHTESPDDFAKTVIAFLRDVFPPRPNAD